MKTAFRGILVLLSLILASAQLGDDHCYVSNQSSRYVIRATTVYNWYDGHSGFVDRRITPGNYDYDVYSNVACNPCSPICTPYGLTLDIWIEAAHVIQGIGLGCDQSVVGYDNAAGTGIDIFHAKYGTINTPNGYIVTIYPQ